MSELKTQLIARAGALGFARVGVARAEGLGVEAERLFAWLRAGRHGEMQYMEETAAVRADPRHPGMLPSAASVVVLVTPYAQAAAQVGPSPGRVARYAQGRDYHNVLLKRARKLAQLLRAAGHTARPGVDLLPIYERAWAQRAGVGFIGKNCCLIVPGLGSHVFITTLLTSAELPADSPMKERCGECSACLTACPTRAFVAPRQLDARRCISYLTIEQRGAVPEELREGVGDWLFGCDACQDVCPYNRGAGKAQGGDTFAVSERWGTYDAERLLSLSEAEYEGYVDGSALKRAGREGLARNAAVVLGNVGQRRHLPVLRDVAEKHESAVVRESAEWAVRRIEERG